MWWCFVPKDHAASAVCLTARFALHQKRDPCGQTINLTGLFGNDIVQVFGQAFQMRQPLFDFSAHLAPFRVAG